MCIGEADNDQLLSQDIFHRLLRTSLSRVWSAMGADATDLATARQMQKK